MKKPLISSIVTVFNTEDTLNSCLESIVKASLHQDDLEIIIVNDGSQGTCKKIIEYYQQYHDNIVYVEHKENLGLYASRQSGVSASTGDYITFVDADDVVTPTIFKELSNIIHSYAYDIISFDFMYLFSDKKKIRHSEKSITVYDKDIFFGLFQYPGYQPILRHEVWNKAFSRKLWEKAEHFFPTLTPENDGGEDLIRTSILCFLAKSFHHINQSFYYYNVGDKNSNSKSISYKKVKRYIEGLAHCLKAVHGLCIKQERFDIKQYDLIEHKLWKDLSLLLYRINLVTPEAGRKTLLKLFFARFEYEIPHICLKIALSIQHDSNLQSHKNINKIYEEKLLTDIEKLYNKTYPSREQHKQIISEIFIRLRMKT